MSSYTITIRRPSNAISTKVQRYSTDAIARKNLIRVVTGAENGFGASLFLDNGTLLTAQKKNDQVVIWED